MAAIITQRTQRPQIIERICAAFRAFQNMVHD